MTKLPVAVCVIAGAEARRIGRALESVAAWAAEIIVVVNEDVKDGTDTIAAKFGAKVFREPWKGFIGQKNSAAEKASSPWLLNLDADEAVPPELAAEIGQVVSSPAAPHAAYEFPRCTFYCGRWIRHGDWYPDRVIRLYKKGAATWTGEEPHASLRVNGTIGRLRSDLLHYNAENIDSQVAKITSFSNDFARRAAAEHRRIRWLDLAVRPAWRFIRCYFVKLGFLDGWPGYHIAWMTAFYTVNRYAKAREAQLSPARPASQPPGA